MQPLCKIEYISNEIQPEFLNETNCVVDLKRAVAEARADFCSEVVQYFALWHMEYRVKSG